MNKTVATIIVVLIAALIAGFVLSSRKPAIAPTENNSETTTTQKSSDGTSTTQNTVVVNDPIDSLLVGKRLANNYFEFTKNDYDELKKLNRPVLLYFYANWCPICRVQEPIIVKFMNGGGANGKIALRVNYNDSDTDVEEKDLARKFNITYQHTFVALDPSGSEVERVNGQQSESDLQQLFAEI